MATFIFGSVTREAVDILREYSELGGCFWVHEVAESRAPDGGYKVTVESGLAELGRGRGRIGHEAGGSPLGGGTEVRSDLWLSEGAGVWGSVERMRWL
jgi:hypothetical protein